MQKSQEFLNTTVLSYFIWSCIVASVDVKYLSASAAREYKKVIVVCLQKKNEKKNKNGEWEWHSVEVEWIRAHFHVCMSLRKLDYK